jgi:response regulator RpfG family c-di-GMP phosphodiesterase
MSIMLKGQYDVREAEDAETALADLVQNPPDVVIADVNLPGLSGTELIERIRSAFPEPDRVKILLVSGAIPAEALGGLAVSGADDFLAKPFSSADLLSRVRSLILRRGGDVPVGNSLTRGGTSTRVLPRAMMTRPVAAPPRQTVGPEALSHTISRLLAETNLVSDGHCSRVIQYVRALTGAATGVGEYTRLKDPAYVDLLTAVAPMYDIGLLAIPRNILMKPDKLDQDELNVVQTHTTSGSDVLQSVAAKFAADLPSLPLAAEIARSHHERWDGSGYPDMLAGSAIPLSARVVALAAVYEALRSRRPHRPALSHARAVNMITTQCPGQFDPVLLGAFINAASRFEQIYSGP